MKRIIVLFVACSVVVCGGGCGRAGNAVEEAGSTQTAKTSVTSSILLHQVLNELMAKGYTPKKGAAGEFKWATLPIEAVPVFAAAMHAPNEPLNIIHPAISKDVDLAFYWAMRDAVTMLQASPGKSGGRVRLIRKGMAEVLLRATRQYLQEKNEAAALGCYWYMVTLPSLFPEDTQYVDELMQLIASFEVGRRDGIVGSVVMCLVHQHNRQIANDFPNQEMIRNDQYLVGSSVSFAPSAVKYRKMLFHLGISAAPVIEGYCEEVLRKNITKFEIESPGDVQIYLNREFLDMMKGTASSIREQRQREPYFGGNAISVSSQVSQGTFLEEVEIGGLEDIDGVLGRSTDLNFRNSSGISPLCQAVGLNRYDLVSVLVKNGADVNFSAVDGRTPLHFAAQFCNPPMSQLLLRSGADGNRRADSGETPADVWWIRHKKNGGKGEHEFAAIIAGEMERSVVALVAEMAELSHAAVDLLKLRSKSIEDHRKDQQRLFAVYQRHNRQVNRRFEATAATSSLSGPGGVLFPFDERPVLTQVSEEVRYLDGGRTPKEFTEDLELPLPPQIEDTFLLAQKALAFSELAYGGGSMKHAAVLKSVNEALSEIETTLGNSVAR